MTAKAQPYQCDHCGRRIGANRSHIVVAAADPPLVVCVRCLGRADHGRAFPDCPHQWHDMHDHPPLIFSSRAAVRAVVAAR
jgi:hypothetical protein